jgi:acetyl esterase/lipase
MANVIVEDMPYRVIDGEALLGRLYRPESGADVLLIDVHGGAWTQNDRLNNAVMHRYLAARGIAVFALDFRMAPAHRYPAALQDVNFGVRWAKANLARLEIAPRLIGGLGTSSGGHQVALNALRPADADFLVEDAGLAGHDAGLDFAVLCWPILDPLARYRMAQAKGLKNLIDAHDAFWPDQLAMATGNPQLILERGEAAPANGKLPPMFILQGMDDENVEHERADLFAAAYRKAGGAVELRKFPEQPHAFITKNPDSAAAADALAGIHRYIAARQAAARS